MSAYEFFCWPAAESILMPPTFPIASLNRYTPKFSGVSQKLTWCQKFALQMFPKGGDADFCPQKNVFLGLVWAILAIRKLFLCLLRGVRFLLANRTPPSSTSETFSNLPAWEVSLEPGGQSPISQEFHVHPPTVDTLETGMTFPNSI